jgi:hypothetical protein
MHAHAQSGSQTVINSKKNHPAPHFFPRALLISSAARIYPHNASSGTRTAAAAAFAAMKEIRAKNKAAAGIS